MICPEGNISESLGKEAGNQKSQWVKYDGGSAGRGKAGGSLARGTVGHKAVRKFRLGVNSWILSQEHCPLVVTSLQLCVSIYFFISIDYLPWKSFKQELCFTILCLAHRIESKAE